MSNAGTSHALEVKAKWAALLTSGAKTVELRAYQLPEDLLNKPLLLLATPDGQEGVSGLADDVPAGCSSAQVVSRKQPMLCIAKCLLFSTSSANANCRNVQIVYVKNWAADACT